jgi:hypothetical protein
MGPMTRTSSERGNARNIYYEPYPWCRHQMTAASPCMVGAFAHVGGLPAGAPVLNPAAVQLYRELD